VAAHPARRGGRCRNRPARPWPTGSPRRWRVDLRPVREGRWLSLASVDELRAAAREGLDVQLHTHRHRFPVSRELALRELRDNRAVLEPLAGRALRHFCYPSGYFRPAHLPWLEEAQVESATTCEPGDETAAGTRRSPSGGSWTARRPRRSSSSRARRIL
jgi:peptidoglycan/xylan/chitin deacetylase (PgdA/CDA1 family)